MVIVLTAVGIVLVLAGLIVTNKSEKCKHNWTKTSSTNTTKEYTFNYQCTKCKERRSETYIVY